jgi:hypothetical protein
MRSRALLGAELSTDARGQAERLGRSWAMELRAALLREKRRASGGWPGTLAEARAHVARAMSNHLISLATAKESEDAVRVAYASARSAWMEICDSDDEG